MKKELFLFVFFFGSPVNSCTCAFALPIPFPNFTLAIMPYRLSASCNYIPVIPSAPKAAVPAFIFQIGIHLKISRRLFFNSLTIRKTPHLNGRYICALHFFASGTSPLLWPHVFSASGQCPICRRCFGVKYGSPLRVCPAACVTFPPGRLPPFAFAGGWQAVCKVGNAGCAFLLLPALFKAAGFALVYMTKARFV